MLSGLVLVAIAAACSSADSGRAPLVVSCEPGSPGCSADRKKSGTGDPVVDGTEGTPTTPVAPPTDAGARPADAGALGYSCTQLKRCCDELTRLKITGSARQCNDTVLLRGEPGCASFLKVTQEPDENGDVICVF